MTAENTLQELRGVLVKKIEERNAQSQCVARLVAQLAQVDQWIAEARQARENLKSLAAVSAGSGAPY